MSLLSATASQGQNIRNIVVDESANGKVLSDFLMQLEGQYNVDFIFNEEKLRALTVYGIQERTPILDYLEYYLVQYQVTRVADNIVFITDNAVRRENYLIIKPDGKDVVSLRGIVTDGNNDEPVAGAQLFIPELNRGTLTNANGAFELDVPVKVFSMSIQYVGYETANYIVGFSRLGNDRRIALSIFTAPRELEGVIISADKIDGNVTGTVGGVEALSIETIKTLPTFLGVTDPIRSLTTLPGISMVGEVASGFNVRGGETGQNLILQDGATIYNPSHLFGFFSAFNPDMINDVVLYKGGGPANFGGRVSSVLDVTLRTGDAGGHKITGGAGLVSSRLAVEGPIIRNRSSYLIGGRISYSNWLLKATDDIRLMNSSAQFYDITGKIFHTLNKNNLVTLSAYKSYDDFRLASDSTFSWGTFNLALKWDHTFTDQWVSTLSLTGSNYFSEILHENAITGFTYRNDIRNLTLKYDIVYSESEHINLLFGLETKGILLEPGELTSDDDTNNVIPADIHDQQALQNAIYGQADLKLSDKISVSAGLRYSHFIRMGKDEIYTFDYGDINGRYPAIVDTSRYDRGEHIITYSGLAPRLSVRYMLNDAASVKASYYRSFQYLHLISNTASVTPQDYRIVSGPHLKPQIGNQFSLGFFKNLENDHYEFSLEGFYKEISNSLDYIEGADITLNPALEAGLAQGKGLAYGIELLLKKNSGIMNGWLSYTFSRSLRKFESSGDLKTINNGQYYPASFDQPHNISVIFNYRLGSRTVLTANFSYSTGRPITIPVSKFSYDAYLSVLKYSERNEYRIPDYHRLDLSLSIKDKPGKSKRFMGEWVFSVFNVYSRDNAYSIFFNRYGRASKLSVLGSIFPSVSYNFSF